MTSIDPSQGDSRPWGDLREVAAGIVAPTKFERAKPPVSRGRRLLGKQDILEAVKWRLSGWTPAAIGAGAALISQLIGNCVPLNDAQPDVVAAMASFPRDRRDPWSAFCALAVMCARRNRELFFTAGMEVMTAYRQAKRAKPGASDELSKLIAARLADDPDVHPDILFNHLADNMWQFTETIVDFNPSADVLTIQPQRDNDAWRDVSRPSFVRRVQREKKKARQHPADVAPMS